MVELWKLGLLFVTACLVIVYTLAGGRHRLPSLLRLYSKSLQEASQITASEPQSNGQTAALQPAGKTAASSEAAQITASEPQSNGQTAALQPAGKTAANSHNSSTLYSKTFLQMFAEVAQVDPAAPAHIVSEGWNNFRGRFLHHWIEYPEHALVRRWIPPNATVLELGARYGTTTCEIAKQIGNSGRVVGVEPDRLVWKSITKNLRKNNCNALVLHGAIGTKPLHLCSSGYAGMTDTNACNNNFGYRVETWPVHAVEKTSGLKFDTLLLDCEGCVQDILDQLQPIIKSQVRLILLEGDQAKPKGSSRKGTDYETFIEFLKNSGFEMVDQFNDCNYNRTRMPGRCNRHIEHYAFIRRLPL